MPRSSLLRVALESAGVMTPALLYHASAYDTPNLKPGFEYTHELVEWDHGESNKFLYATTDKASAIELGIASAIEHRHRLDRFHTDTRKVVITTPDTRFTRRSLEQLEVWLYEILPNARDHWKANLNPANGLQTEFKTEQTVQYRVHRRVNVAQWAEGRKIEIIHS